MDIDQFKNLILSTILIAGLLISSTFYQDESQTQLPSRSTASQSGLKNSRFISKQEHSTINTETYTAPASFKINSPTKKSSQKLSEKIVFSNVMIQKYILLKGLSAIPIQQYNKMSPQPKIMKQVGHYIVFESDIKKTYNVLYNSDNNSLALFSGEFSISATALGLNGIKDPQFNAQIEFIERSLKAKYLTYIPEKQQFIFAIIRQESSSEELFLENLLHELDQLQLNPPAEPIIRSAIFKAQ